MNNETKRNVFDKLLSEYVDDERRIDGLVYEPDQHIPELDREYFINSYATALPDDLPVIPKAVGEYIQWGKSYDIQLYMMYSFKFIHSQGFKKLTDDVESWIISSSNAFARAWLLGVWRVEETGEIVKLEASK